MEKNRWQRLSPLLDELLDLDQDERTAKLHRIERRMQRSQPTYALFCRISTCSSATVFSRYRSSDLCRSVWWGR
jgi:hypothetical protein